MRKGFTLILATVALSFLAVTAMAKGPTIAGVPDVYISQNDASGVADISASANMFRFSNALNLWDYITTGSEEAETSDKVYWGYGIKDADYATKQASGSFLTGSAAHYTIGNQAALTAAQAAAVNSQTLQTIQAAGVLTFRNVRLSPVPDAVPYPAPDKSPVTLPGNVLDFQQATLFVTDKVTSESSDDILLITIDGGRDAMSMAGPSWTTVRTFSDFNEQVSGAAYWQFSELDITTLSGTTPITSPKTTSQLQIRTNSFTGVGALGAYGLWAPPSAAETVVAAGDLTKIYRLKATISSSSAVSTGNPDIRLYMNGQTQGPGLGMLEFAEGGAYGPTSTAASYAAYLWPANAGTFGPSFMVYNTTKPDTTITITTNLVIETLNQSDLTGGTVLKDVGQGGANGGFVAGTGAGQWSTAGTTGFGGVFGYTSSPTFTSSLTSNLLSFGITSTLGAATAGLVKYGASDLFTASADKLVVVKVNANASVAGKAPQMRILASKGNQNAIFYLSNASNTAFIGTTAKDYYAVFATNSANAGAYSLGVEAIALDTGASGSIQVHRVTVTEYPLP